MSPQWDKAQDGTPLTHVYPVGDLRQHVTNGDPCPCLAHMVDGVVVHHSYDKRETGKVCRRALDLWGKHMLDSNATWTTEDRRIYDHALHILDMHWPEVR